MDSPNPTGSALSEAVSGLVDESNLLLDGWPKRPLTIKELSIIDLVLEEIMTAEQLLRTLRKIRGA